MTGRDETDRTGSDKIQGGGEGDKIEVAPREGKEEVR